MRRREFITLVCSVAVAWPIAARAQQAAKVWRIGFLAGAPRQANSVNYASFVEGMRQLGYVENKDYVIEYRTANEQYERFSELAGELIQLKVDVIVTAAGAAIRTLQNATTTIPIVWVYSTDPVGNRFVTSLARPGGNITGLAASSNDTAPKQLELLAMIAPSASRIGVLGNPINPNFASVLKNVQVAGERAGLSIMPVEAGNVEDAFAAFDKQGIQGVIATTDAVFFAQRGRIAELALARRLPMMFSQREYVEAGGLMSYGENLSDFFRRAAVFVDKIFKGANAGDLPIEQPTQFHLAINHNTADALGLTIPPQLYTFADEVIEKSGL
jgi:putative ABC transport system substrate-binding protein